MIENRFLDYLASTYIAPQSEAVEPVMAPGQQPGDILVAEVGSRGLPESVYSGEPPRAEMKPYDPSLIERAAHNVQMWLEGLGVDRYKARQNAQSLIGGASSNLPFGIGFLDALGSLPKIGVPVGMAMSPFYVDQAQRLGKESLTAAEQGRYGAAAMEAGLGALSLIPGVQAGMYVAKEGAKGIAKGAEYLGPKAAEMAQQGIEKVMAPMMPRIVEPGPSMGDAAKAAAPVSDIGFYSAVEKAASGLQRKSGTGQSFLNDITKGENVKADEIKWMGLDDFLKGKKNVTKQEVQDYIAQNRVDVQEVQLGGAQPYDAQRLAQLESEYKALKQHPIDDPAFGQEKYDELIRLMNIRDQSTTQSLYDAAEQATRSAQRAWSQGNKTTAKKYFREAEFLNTRAEKLDLQGLGMSNPPKFGTYTLPGGENYREILLTMPNVKGAGLTAKETERLNALVDKRVGSSLAGLDDAEQKEYFALIKKREESASGYKSSHWDQPNVLAHIRVNDRVDADGKKMLLIEEVQSDWHQAGREKGYKSDVNPEENKALVKQWDTLANERRDLERIVAVGDDADPAVQSAVQRLSEISNELNAVNDRLTQVRTTFREGVPDAPFKDTWYQLALKRAMKYAADNGYDRIGLTTGARQAERYDLSRQIEEVYAEKRGGGYLLTVMGKEDNLVFDSRGNTMSASKLEEYVGKELAQKIIDDLSGESIAHTYSGLDLRVGGEGMKKYYDEIYPKFLDKYGKKWGAKVGETTINLQKDLEGFMPRKDMQIESVRYIDITPEMKASTSEGQPLFTATGVGAGTAGATMDDRKQQGRGAE